MKDRDMELISLPSDEDLKKLFADEMVYARMGANRYAPILDEWAIFKYRFKLYRKKPEPEEMDAPPAD